MNDKLFIVGAAREDITPVIGTLLFGYNPFTESKSVHDPLHATAIAFAQGDQCAILFSVTIGGFQNELSDELRRTIGAEVGIPAENIILSATHTHSGPNTVGMEGWGDIDRVYVDTVLRPALCRAAKQAVDTLQPAELAVGVVHSEIGINRRQQMRNGAIALGQNPRGCFDPQMTCVAIRNRDTKAGIINLIHYGCHGTAAGLQTEISRDWSGIMTDRLEAVSGTMTAYINGAEGDVGPRLTNGQTTADFRYVEELGGYAASDAIRAYRALGVYTVGELKLYHGTVHIPRKPLLPRETAQAMLANYPNPDALYNLGRMEYLYFKSTLDEYDAGCPAYEHEMTFPQTILSLGDTAFVPFPFEIFSEVTMRLQEYSPIRYTLSLSNTNGYNAYLPSEDQLVRGGYEIACFRYNCTHPLIDSADQVLIDENLRLMTQEIQ
ncbi:MAG: hypothetical protein E7604_13205 [Ruminococcaceae bacterium]|nr:hypothetical protein [Oscillospiraceae bacterium]